MEENLPPGFRFHPTDEELITCYLTRKVSDTSFTSKAMVDVDLNKCEPWDLPGNHHYYYYACFKVFTRLYLLKINTRLLFFLLLPAVLHLCF
jgi:hypothetical protein